MKPLLLLAAALPLFGQSTPCTYGLASTGVISDATATDTSNPANIPGFTVNTQNGCPFVAISGVAWLHVLAPGTGTTFSGTSKVSFTVDANTTDQLRTGQILVYPGTQVVPGGTSVSFTVVQIAGICNYSLSPTSASIAPSGGSGTVMVTSGCAWGANVSQFINVSAPNGTIGSQPINYTVPANTCSYARSGSIALVTSAPNPPSFQLTQAGSPSNFTISTTAVTDPSTALTNQRLSVTTGTTCVWGSYTDSPNWLHLTGTLGGTGSSPFTYNVDANQGAQRVGHIFFQSGVDAQGNALLAATLTITQQAVQGTGPVLSAIVSDASYDLGTAPPPPISPGEIVALFGTNLGPAIPVVNSQSFGTNLAGVQVMFGNTAAPIVFVSSKQVNVVVPYGVAGLNTVAVTVQYSGLPSNTLTVPVQATTPGIFSYDSSGTGPGAILNNADFSLNSAARPAAVGSVVDLYCTGGGVTVPASTDGALATATPPFPSLAAQDVKVTIGGISAQVVYAGPAPGLINGLTQINVIVPSGVKSGPSVPVVLTIGGVSSQSNLSMAVQ